jgi:predicted metal-dependent hydrolase
MSSSLVLEKTHQIIFGSEIINYKIIYCMRKTLEISVYPDLSVVVKAPKNTTYSDIQEKVKKRAYWIIKQKSYFSSFLPKTDTKKYLSGETHLYLGKQYRLKIVESDNELVKLKSGFIFIFTKEKNNSENTKKLLFKWYKNHATEKFQEKLIKCFNKAEKYNIVFPALKIRKMSKRWGSCTKNQILNLNLELIKVPSHCIEYVIMHELCHLKYHNHSPKFYKLLNILSPDWEKTKKRLEEFNFG